MNGNIQKQLERLTTQKDVKKFTETNRLTPEMSTLLWDICKTMKLPNINYLIKQPEIIAEKFKEYYYLIKNQNITAEDLNLFFELNFTIEKIVATTKGLLSTKQFTIDSVVFYLTQQSEQYPFYVKANTNDFISLEIPKFAYCHQ